MCTSHFLFLSYSGVDVLITQGLAAAGLAYHERDSELIIRLPSTPNNSHTRQASHSRGIETAEDRAPAHHYVIIKVPEL